jgi:hypothetical protein
MRHAIEFSTDSVGMPSVFLMASRCFLTVSGDAGWLAAGTAFDLESECGVSVGAFAGA